MTNLTNQISACFFFIATFVLKNDVFHENVESDNCLKVMGNFGVSVTISNTVDISQSKSSKVVWLLSKCNSTILWNHSESGKIVQVLFEFNSTISWC